MRTNPNLDGDELRPEYDFDYSKAVQGKYYKKLLEEGTNVVILEPKVADVFSGSSGRLIEFC